MELAAQTRLGRAPGLVDALRGLEFDLACHQSRFARFAADFLCCNPLRHCSDCSTGGLIGKSALVTAARLRLRDTGFDRRSDVRCQLWPSVLGRTARFIRSSCRVTGDHPDLWDAFRASDASRRTAATAETFRRTARAWRCSYDL